MLDLKYIRKYPDEVKKAIKAKKEKADLDKILELDKNKRDILTKVEVLKKERKEKSKEIGKAKKNGLDISAVSKDMGKLSQKIKDYDVKIAQINKDLNNLLLWIPNIPMDDVPYGTEEQNVILRNWKEPKNEKFEYKPHWDLGSNLNILELERASKISGTSFTMYNGIGARFERALLNFMLDVQAGNGYREVNPPLLVNRRTVTGSGQLPKLENDMYFVASDDFFLIPTSEVALINFYQNEIIPTDQLPICLMAATPCFRREAGAAGKDNRGLLRVHQFNKVELIHFVKPEDSNASLEKILSDAEMILQKLDIPYRIVLLASEDLSFASAKTYDIEIWAPGVKRWLEVSSCSNCKDFQARRANIRYKEKGGKNQFVHTLNGSGLAVPRLMVSILENYQQEDGHIRIPEALVPYMDGMTVI